MLWKKDIVINFSINNDFPEDIVTEETESMYVHGINIITTKDINYYCRVTFTYHVQEQKGKLTSF